MAKLYPITTAHNHDEVYAKIGESGVTDHGLLTGLEDNDHPQYLLTTAKAADSDKLDNIDSTGFVQTSGNQTVGGIKTFTSIPALPSSNPTTANQAVRKGFADATYVGLTGDETIAGVKTFSSIPVLPATNPTLANQAVRKGYADAAYLSISGKAADADKLDGVDSTGFVKTDEIGAWVDWTPTVTGWAAGYTVNAARYKLIGKTCFFTVDISGTSNSTAVNIVMPFTSYSGAGSPVWGGTNAYVQNNGTVATVASRWYIGENSATLIAYTDMSSGAWTASGAKRIRVMGFYETA